MTGKGRCRQRAGLRLESGVTLIELLVVICLISLLAAITFPSVSSGLDSLRLTAACDSIVSFLNAGLDRAERRQEVVEVSISKQDNELSLTSSEPGFTRNFALTDGISILSVLPELPIPADAPRRFLLMPGGTIPRFGVEIANRRGVRRIVRVDPITGVPQIEKLEGQ